VTEGEAGKEAEGAKTAEAHRAIILKRFTDAENAEYNKTSKAAYEVQDLKADNPGDYEDLHELYDVRTAGHSVLVSRKTADAPWHFEDDNNQTYWTPSGKTKEEAFEHAADIARDLEHASEYEKRRKSFDETGAASTIYDLSKELALPKGWTLKDTAISESSHYWMVEGPDGTTYKLRVSDHEANIFREKEFGGNDGVFYAKPLTPETFNDAMKRMEDWIRETDLEDRKAQKADAALTSGAAGIKTPLETPSSAESGAGLRSTPSQEGQLNAARMTSSSTAGDVALRTVPPIKSSRMVSEATQPQSAEPVKPENEISLAGAVGMGGALRTENLSPGGPAEQTLLDTLRNFSPKGAQSGLTTVPMAERLADTVTGIKTGLQNWWLRTRAASEQTKRLLFGLGPEATGDYWSTKRELLKDKQVNEGTSLRVIKEGARLAPDPLVRKAMGKFAEASMFDNPDEMLGEWANGSQRVATRRQYEMARQLTPEQKKVAHQAVQFFLGKGEELKNAGLLSHLIEDYAGQHMVDFRHNESPAEMNALRADLASGKLNTNFRYALKRTFQTEYDLERAGYKLKTTDLFDKLANYVKTANNVLANRAAVKEWMNGESADGRPLFASGLSRRLVEATDGRPNPALFVNPKVRPHPKIKDAEGNDVDVSGEYVKLEHPAFKKWQWVEMDPESGRTVWVQGDVWAHKSIAGDLRNTLEGSTLYSRIPGVSTLTRVNSQAKGIKLVGLFHHVKTDTHALFHMTMPWKFYARKLDLNDPWTQQKMRWGVTYFEPNGSELFSEGLASSSVLQKLAGVTGKVGEAVTGSEAFGRAVNIGERLKNYQEFLFQHHIPLVKDAVFEDAYRRNLQRYSRNPAGARGAVTQMMRYVPVVRKFRPVLTNDQIGQLSAHQMNSAFGLVSWRLYGINPTFQHVLRLSLLAPDFQAAQTAFMAQLMSRTGAEQRMAAAIMVGTVYTTARILNEIFDKNPHWEAKHAFSVIYGNRAYGFRTVASDVVRAFTSTSQFVYHKLAPLPSALGEWLTGIDVLGRKETRGRAYVNMAERLVPIPLTPRSDLNFVEGAMAGTFGYYENRYSAVSDLRGKARHWMKWNKDPKLQAAAAAQTQSSYPESAYLKLDHELQDGQLPAAAKEYNALLDAGKTTKEILQRFSLTRPFITGDRATDLRFQMSFSPVDQRLYQQATALRAKQYQALLRVIPREQLRAAITPTPQRVKDFMLQRLGASDMQIAFNKLELGDAIQVWEAANDRQKVALAPFLVQKEEAKFNALSQQVRSGRLNQTVAAVQTEAIAREVRLVAPYWRRAANPGAPAAGVNGTNRSAMMRQ